MIMNDNYAIESWLADLISIIKNRAFLDKKENAFLVFVENATFFLERYEDKYSPMEAFIEFEEGED
jgi:hypothetical protein